MVRRKFAFARDVADYELLVEGAGLEVFVSLRLAHRIRVGTDPGRHLAGGACGALLTVFAAQAAVVRRRLSGRAELAGRDRGRAT